MQRKPSLVYYMQPNETRSSAIAVIADRTACSILTLFIVTATSRPLNKKSVCCQSANPINNYCGSASANPQSAHLSARALQSARPWWAVAPNGTVSSVMLTSRLAALETPLLCIGSQVAVRFLWCILWLNDKSYSKSVKRDK